MRSETIAQDDLEQFFESGEDHVKRIWNEIEMHFVSDFRPERSLDFGCGVGRITFPLAKRSETAVGVDISTGMLEIAEKKVKLSGAENITFIKGDDSLSKVTGKFDFVHSFIVFQHIDPRSGMAIFKKIVELLSDNGIGVLHFEYANSVSTTGQKLRFRLYRDIPLIYSLRNLILKKRKEPLIPMYQYDLNEIMLHLQQNDCHNCLIRFSQHGVDGVLIFFQKKKEALY
jgi:ubiquinone/menaquinone biosynthesis C-methylase UbiE